MQEFNSCKCQAVREMQTRRKQSRLKVNPAHKVCYRTALLQGAGESRVETKQRIFCFLFITAFMGVIILDHCLQWKSCVCFSQEFLSAFFFGGGESSTYLHPFNPFPPCPYFTLWHNLKALLFLPLISWLEASSGNITQSCSSPQGQSLCAARFCSSTPSAVKSQAFHSPAWLSALSRGGSLSCSGN